MQKLSPDAEVFRQQTQAIFDQAGAVAASLDNNTVQVYPGGSTFNSIRAAMDSITDASATRQYTVMTGPGTYNENVEIKPYVHLIGAGADQTFITSPPGTVMTGVINAAGDGGISQCTVTATGGEFGSYPVALLMLQPCRFHARGVNFTATDNGNSGNNIRTITNNTGAESGLLILGNCKVQALNDGGSPAVAVEVLNEGYQTYIELSNISCAPMGWGVNTAAMGIANLLDCTITGQYFALNNTDQASPITATGCIINGPVSAGVVVNNQRNVDAAG